MSTVQWEEPPPAGSASAQGQRISVEISRELQRRPGEWARWPRAYKGVGASQIAYRINNGISASWRPAGSYEAVTRKGQDGTISLWVRYVGDTRD
jgi:hypothetical protein